MNVLKIIGKVLLTILRVPFTIWYVVIGLILKFLSVVEKLMVKFGEKDKASLGGKVLAILAFEWASLVKFYHLYW